MEGLVHVHALQLPELGTGSIQVTGLWSIALGSSLTQVAHGDGRTMNYVQQLTCDFLQIEIPDLF